MKRRKNKGCWFCYTCCVWLVNLILTILSYFVSEIIYAAPILFLAILIGWGSIFFLLRTEDTHIGDALAESDRWCLAAAGFAVIYAIVNSIECMWLLHEGSPLLQDGKYYLYNKEIIREITKGEYNSLMIAQGRLSIGLMLLFSTIALVFHSGRKNLNVE